MNQSLIKALKERKISYRLEEGRVIVEGEANLSGCTNLTSIDNAVFEGEANLGGCTNLTSIDNAVFEGEANLGRCTSLTSAAGAVFKEYACLSFCVNLTSVAGAVFRGDVSLYGCTSLTSIAGSVFEGGVSFLGCTGLTSIEGAVFKEYVSLFNCTSLTSIEGAVFGGKIYFTGRLSTDAGVLDFDVIDRVPCVVLSKTEMDGITIKRCREALIKDGKLVGEKFVVASDGKLNAHGRGFGGAGSDCGTI